MIKTYRNLQHPSIPENLYAGISNLPEAKTEHVPMEHSVESLSGRELLKKMIMNCYKQGNPAFKTLKYEKPSAKLNGDIVSVSFSHTSKAVAAVFSKNWVVGIDMEFADRQVNERLAKRMKHVDESFKLYEKNPIIKIWTMKEAALKAIGTGLRQPMNSVHLASVSEYTCSARFSSGITANITSFKMWGQWISICYIVPKLTTSFLSEAYVPI